MAPLVVRAKSDSFGNMGRVRFVVPFKLGTKIMMSLGLRVLVSFGERKGIKDRDIIKSFQFLFFPFLFLSLYFSYAIFFGIGRKKVYNFGISSVPSPPKKIKK